MPEPRAFVFERAVKSQEKLRMALDGPPGAGKTWTALIVGCFLAEKAGGRVALIDSERSSARKYAPHFEFDHLTLPDFMPHTYDGAVKAAVRAGYPVIIVDSLSHAWEGTLDLKDQVAKRQKTQNSFTAWREVTPVHEALVDTLTRASAHVIVTLRTKVDYLVEEGQDGQKSTVKKVGLAPVQRQGVEYEFDVVGDMDVEHTLTISKSRCFELADAVIRRPDVELAERLEAWLSSGEPVVSPEQAAEVRAVIGAIEDRQARHSAQELFRARYGSPDEIRASQATEAMAFAKALAGTEEPPLAPAEKPPDPPKSARSRGKARAQDNGSSTESTGSQQPANGSGPDDEGPPETEPEGDEVNAEAARWAGEPASP